VLTPQAAQGASVAADAASAPAPTAVASGPNLASAAPDSPRAAVTVSLNCELGNTDRNGANADNDCNNAAVNPLAVPASGAALSAMSGTGAARGWGGAQSGGSFPIDVYCQASSSDLDELSANRKCGDTHFSRGEDFFLTVDLPSYTPGGRERFRVFAAAVYRGSDWASHLGWHMCGHGRVDCSYSVSPQFPQASQLRRRWDTEFGRGWVSNGIGGATKLRAANRASTSSPATDYALMVTVWDWYNRRHAFTIIPLNPVS
jgi:hypothetical protein